MRGSPNMVAPTSGFGRSRGGLVGPPWISFSSIFFVFLATLILAILTYPITNTLSVQDGPKVFGGGAANFSGFLVGSFLGPAALAWFSVEYNKRVSGRRFIEKFESRLVGRGMAIAAWFLGSWNIFWWALEVSR
jgi:hypothetical protein